MAPQTQLVLKHLEEHRSITPMEAHIVYKIRSLPRRILDLKRQGIPIQTEMRRDAHGQRYARYTLS